MIYIAFLLCILGLLIGLASILKVNQSSRGNYYFVPKKLMSRPEQILYLRLVEALPEHLVFPQVGLSRVIEAKGQERRKGFFSISQKSLDYVVCNKDMNTLVAIELDDATHNRADRIKADQVKDEALTSGEIPIIRWNVKQIPDIATIQRTIAEHLHIDDRNNSQGEIPTRTEERIEPFFGE